MSIRRLLSGGAFALTSVAALAGARADGSFLPPATWADEMCASPAGCFVADLDGNGHPDVIEVGFSGETPPASRFVALNNGSRLAPAARWLSSPAICQSPVRCTVGDFDGDGLADVVDTQSPGSNRQWMVSRSDGSRFLPAEAWDAANRGTSRLAHPVLLTGRFTADDRDDVLVFGLRPDSTQVHSDYSRQAVEVYPSLGTRFGAAVYTSLGLPVGPYPNGSWSPRHTTFAAGDVNGDGLDDLVLFARASAKVYVGTNRGEGRFRPLELWATDFCDRGDECRIADLDGDGQADAVAFSADGAGTVKWARLHRYSFKVAAEPKLSGFCRSTSTTCELADMDLDGSLDAVSVGSTSHGGVQVARWQDAPSSGPSRPRVPLPDFDVGVAVGEPLVAGDMVNGTAQCAMGVPWLHAVIWNRVRSYRVEHVSTSGARRLVHSETAPAGQVWDRRDVAVNDVDGVGPDTRGYEVIAVDDRGRQDSYFTPVTPIPFQPRVSVVSNRLVGSERKIRFRLETQVRGWTADQLAARVSFFGTCLRITAGEFECDMPASSYEDRRSRGWRDSEIEIIPAVTCAGEANRHHVPVAGLLPAPSTPVPDPDTGNPPPPPPPPPPADRPDLVVAISNFGEHSATITVRNVGRAAVSESFWVDWSAPIYESFHPSASTKRSIDGLAAGGSVSFDISVGFRDFQSAPHPETRLTAVVDPEPGSLVAESNEDNNAASAAR